MAMLTDYRREERNELRKAIRFLLMCALWVWTNCLLVLLSDQIETLKMSYSSHNTIECREVSIFHSGTYDVGEGSGVLREGKDGE